MNDKLKNCRLGLNYEDDEDWEFTEQSIQETDEGSERLNDALDNMSDDELFKKYGRNIEFELKKFDRWMEFEQFCEHSGRGKFEFVNSLISDLILLSNNSGYYKIDVFNTIKNKILPLHIATQVLDWISNVKKGIILGLKVTYDVNKDDLLTEKTKQQVPIFDVDKDSVYIYPINIDLPESDQVKTVAHLREERLKL